MPSVHDISSLDNCISDMREVLGKIEKAAEGAFPNSKWKYTSVNVLLISWVDDQLGVAKEILQLKRLLEIGYMYHTEHWQIPSEEPDDALAGKLLEFRRAHRTENDLLIIYYGGHGYLDDDRQLIWSCHEPNDDSDESMDDYDSAHAPTVQWFSHAALFNPIVNDVLILLDCCAAAGARDQATGGIKEVIAACGFETWSPGDRKDSFTGALIKILEMMQSGPPFSVANLHSRVLEQLRQWSPVYHARNLLRRGKDGRLKDIERRKTPVHISLNREPAGYVHRSIQLMSMSTAKTDPGLHCAEKLAQFKAEKPKHTDVIISVRIRPGQVIKPEDVANWVKDIPLLAMSFKLHAISHDSDTLVLLSVPIAVWDLLPENMPCAFVGYASSPNMLTPWSVPSLRDSQLGLESLLLEEATPWNSPLLDLMYRGGGNILLYNSRIKESALLKERFYETFFRVYLGDPQSPHQHFAAAMSHCNYGHGLLDPEAPSILKPGACGLLTETGRWTPITNDEGHDLYVPDDDPITLLVDLSHEFGLASILCGGSISVFYGISVDDQNQSLEGFPKEFTSVLRFGLTEGFGALLLPSVPIIHRKLHLYEEAILWAKNNARSILIWCPRVKELGFFIATSTYSTSDFGILTRNGSPDSEYLEVARKNREDQTKSGHWAFNSSFDVGSGLKQYDEEYVVFFEGIYFTYRELPLSNTAGRAYVTSSSESARKAYDIDYIPFITSV